MAKEDISIQVAQSFLEQKGYTRAKVIENSDYKEYFYKKGNCTTAFWETSKFDLSGKVQEFRVSGVIEGDIQEIIEAFNLIPTEGVAPCSLDKDFKMNLLIVPIYGLKNFEALIDAIAMFEVSASLPIYSMATKGYMAI